MVFLLALRADCPLNSQVSDLKGDQTWCKISGETPFADSTLIHRNACGVSLATRRDSRWTRRHVQKGMAPFVGILWRSSSLLRCHQPCIIERWGQEQLLQTGTSKATSNFPPIDGSSDLHGQNSPKTANMCYSCCIAPKLIIQLSRAWTGQVFAARRG